MKLSKSEKLGKQRFPRATSVETAPKRKTAFGQFQEVEC